jgi:hypothetical protein
MMTSNQSIKWINTLDKRVKHYLTNIYYLLIHRDKTQKNPPLKTPQIQIFELGKHVTGCICTFNEGKVSYA